LQSSSTALHDSGAVGPAHWHMVTLFRLGTGLHDQFADAGHWFLLGSQRSVHVRGPPGMPTIGVQACAEQSCGTLQFLPMSVATATTHFCDVVSQASPGWVQPGGGVQQG
jgi:hypothetical protein